VRSRAYGWRRAVLGEDADGDRALGGLRHRRQVAAAQRRLDERTATVRPGTGGRADINLGSDGFWWLYRVAVREVWRLTSEARRERSIDTDALDGMVAQSDDVAATAERRLALRTLHELPERQARLLFLHGCGFTYQEIARMTGATYRTVDRQLCRARERLRDADHHCVAAREEQVLDRLVDGLTIRAIALELDIGQETVRGYLLGAYRKLGVRSRGQAIAAHLARRSH
jgi:RNA polymerase sigma factor (sigma-70 family)